MHNQGGYYDSNGVWTTVGEAPSAPTTDEQSDRERFDAAVADGQRDLDARPQTRGLGLRVPLAPESVKRATRTLPLGWAQRTELQQTINNLIEAALPILVHEPWFVEASDEDRGARVQAVLSRVPGIASASCHDMPATVTDLHARMTEFLRAFGLFLTWQAIPSKRDVSLADELPLRPALDYYAAVERRSHNAAVAVQQTREKYGDDVLKACRRFQSAPGNPRKLEFWRAHADLLSINFPGAGPAATHLRPALWH